GVGAPAAAGCTGMDHSSDFARIAAVGGDRTNSGRELTRARSNFPAAPAVSARSGHARVDIDCAECIVGKTKKSKATAPSEGECQVRSTLSVVFAVMLAAGALASGRSLLVRAQDATPAAYPATTEEENIALVRRWYGDVYDQRDLDAIDELLSDSYT